MMKRTRTKYPQNITASDSINPTWENINSPCIAARDAINALVGSEYFDKVWDIYAEASNSGNLDKIQQLVAASEQLRDAVSDDIEIYKKQIDNIAAGEYTRIIEVDSSTKVQASYEEWDGYIEPEWILERSDVPNIEEATKLADWIHQGEYTSGFATPDRWFDYYDLDELYQEMLEEGQ